MRPVTEVIKLNKYKKSENWDFLKVCKDRFNSTFERVEEFKYLGTTLTKKIIFWKKLRAD